MSGQPRRPQSIAEFREAARRALPKMVFDFFDGGAYEETTLRHNREALDQKRLMASAPVDVSIRSQQTTLFGKTYAMPLIIGPTGLAGVAWPDGDVALARAAGKAGIPFVMSTAATCTQEKVAGATQNKWMQLYIFKDRNFSHRIVDKADALGFEALEVTVDSAVAGRRLRDVRNGFSLPFRWSPSKIFSLATHPAWTLRMALAGSPQLEVMAAELGLQETHTISELMQSQLDPSVTWDDIARLRDRWKKPLIVKGLLDPRHVKRAIAIGVDGIVISNHGGRQLDGAASTIDVLPEFASEAGGRLTLLIDSGFRTGADIARALSLGASAVQVGRATLYALSTGGEGSVAHAIALLKQELDIVQALTGASRIENFHPRMIHQQRPIDAVTLSESHLSGSAKKRWSDDNSSTTES
ncbi:alpha-hydroxy-acid oxidizing protein [Mesorhizobium sp. CO1-1-11]|uniref:alpha-hydroxy acid oxidase n=1 Tax=Mesorhizobium sp. CO1-1-11 TaxID=2876636 RepID=UPI001CC93635|nr:alpha-hydroxy acid oxidase [Mesorhizobium sp. CO1-1-11]MBZ9726321.1 alpha-hydroxy-acid oxidizing protein [Mesorhizobium sp. CO1-1-11]